MRILLGLALCACAASAWANPVPQQQQGADTATGSPTAFADGVRAYVVLQKSLEGSLPTVRSTTEQQQIADHQRALAGRIAAARRDTRQGNIFTPTVAAQFHAIILTAFQSPDGRNMLRTIQEGDPVALPILRVNDVYPEDVPLTTMPPTLLRLLPDLPTELAYRIVGRALVLKDVETNVIVDFTPDAIPGAR